MTETGSTDVAVRQLRRLALTLREEGEAEAAERLLERVAMTEVPEFLRAYLLQEGARAFVCETRAQHACVVAFDGLAEDLRQVGGRA